MNNKMADLFGFLNDLNNYEDRKVENTEIPSGIVDTAAVSDGLQPYETGICSEYYNSGRWVIVEAYDTIELAKEGHAKWVKKLSVPYDHLPEELCDCMNASLASEFLDPDECVFAKQ